MTDYGQKCPLPFHVFTYLFEKKGLFLHENNEGIFVKMRSNFGEGLDFQNLVFKRSFYQITLKLIPCTFTFVDIYSLHFKMLKLTTCTVENMKNDPFPFHFF